MCLALESAIASDVKYENIELLSLVDANPQKGELIQYHEVYELYTPRDRQTRTPDTTYSIHLAKVPWEAPTSSHPEMKPARRNSNRTYSASELNDGIIIVEHKDMSFSHPAVRETIKGTIEDPRAIEDPLDSAVIALLKKDMERLKTSAPVRAAAHRQKS
jgi:hypothetical protein